MICFPGPIPSEMFWLTINLVLTQLFYISNLLIQSKTLEIQLNLMERHMVLGASLSSKLKSENQRYCTFTTKVSLLPPPEKNMLTMQLI